MLKVLGDRKISITREATKLFEETYRGPISGAIEKYEGVKPRGEIAMVLEGAEPVETPIADDEGIEARLKTLMDSGMSERDAVRQATVEFKIPKRKVYEAALRLKGERD